MNQPVTHGECLTCRREIEQKFYGCIKDERLDFKEALDGVEEWVERLEQKITKISDSIDNLIKTLLIGMLLIFIEFVWGRL